MAQTNYTPISIYYSATTTNVPTAGNLVAGELAINTADGKLFYKDSSGVVQTLATKNTSAGTFTSITDSGNFTFTGTGNRIIGDFTSAAASRVLFQTSTTNGGTTVAAIPNGSSSTAQLQVLNSSTDPNNSAYALMRVDATSVSFRSDVLGTGTQLPLTMYIGSSEKMRIDTAGNVGIGTTSIAANTKLSVSGGRSSFVANSDAYSIGVGYASAGAYYIGANSGNDSLLFSNSAGSEKMRIDSSGNLIVGTTSALSSSAGRTDLTINGASTGAIISFGNAGSRVGYLYQDGTDFSIANEVAGAIRFLNNGSERMRIDSSGSLLIGRTSNTRTARLEVTGGGSYANGISVSTSVSTAANYEGIYTSASGTVYFGLWTYNGTSVGSISSTGTVTVYSTTSDYRLKTNVSPMTGALATVQALKPVTYKWKTTGEASQGFIAHELQAVVPECVVGEKDAVNEDGSIKPQGIDTSFLVATLTAAIQEQQALIESLTTRLTALENK